MMVVICASIRRRPPQHRARPIKSASAPSSVNLAPTKIRQVRRPAKHVRLERIKIRLGRMIARVVQPILTALLKLQIVTTMPPAVQQEHVLAELQLAKVLRRRWCTKNGKVEDARMGVLVGGGSRRRQRARWQLVRLDGRRKILGGKM